MRTVNVRPIPGFDGYWAGEDGSIWSTRIRDRIGGPFKRMSPAFAGRYLSVMLCFGKGTKPKRRYVHQLVLFAWKGERPPGMEAIHENDIKTDNRVSNLSWGTKKRNTELRSANGRQPKGESQWKSKLTARSVRWIRQNTGKISVTSMARMLKVSVPTVSNVITRTTWKHER